MSSTDSSDLHTLRLQVAALQQRVSLLEEAIKPSAANPQPVPPTASFDRAWAERQTRLRAQMEYAEQESLNFYRGHPRVLEQRIEEEEKKHAFLRERGIEPEESTLMKIANQLAKERSEV